ncbi:hypothetical protein AtEden1_Chr5g0083851 [Arabidopsis thaliana]
MENEVGWMNEVSKDSSNNGESFIEIQINKAARTTGLSISSSPSPENEMQTTTAIFSSATSCFSAYSSVTRLMMKVGWVLQVIQRRRNKSPLRYYYEGSMSNNKDEALTDDSLKAAIAYCNASSLSPLQT